MADHNTHIIDRPFNALGVERERGEVVDTSHWHNPQPLVVTHRMHPAPYGLDEDAVDCECGRRWATIDFALAHNCSARATARTEEKAAKARDTKVKENA